jgi:hypothetical protein
MAILANLPVLPVTGLTVLQSLNVIHLSIRFFLSFAQKSILIQGSKVYLKDTREQKRNFLVGKCIIRKSKFTKCLISHLFYWWRIFNSIFIIHLVRSLVRSVLFLVHHSILYNFVVETGILLLKIHYSQDDYWIPIHWSDANYYFYRYRILKRF